MSQDLYEMRKLAGLPLFEAADFNPLLESWTTAGRAISEAKLSPEQITALFGAIEQGARASGNNRTLVGKGADAAGAAASAVNNAYQGIIAKIGQLGPVKNFDNGFDSLASKLKDATGGDQGLAKYVYAYRALAKKHPIIQNVIYGALTAAVGLATGGATPIAVLGLMKMTDRLLQGDKLSAAMIKGGVTAGAAGLGRELASYLKGSSAPYEPGDTGNPSAPNTFEPGDTGEGGVPQGTGGGDSVSGGPAPTPGTGAGDSVSGGPAPTPGTGAGDSVSGGPAPTPGTGAGDSVSGGPAPTAPSTAQGFRAGTDLGPQDYTNLKIPKGANLSSLAKQYNVSVKDLVDANPQYAANPDAIQAGATIKIPRPTGNSIYQAGVGTAADTAKRVAAAGAKKVTNSSQYVDQDATMQDWFLREGVLDDGSRSVYVYESAVPVIFQTIEEAGFMQGLKNIGSAIGRGVSNFGSNLANKITADKLNTAWKKSTYSQGGGSVDSKTVLQFLRQMGVDDVTIKATFKNMKIPFPRGPRAPKQAPAGGTAQTASGATAPQQQAPAAPQQQAPAAPQQQAPAAAPAASGAAAAAPKAVPNVQNVMKAYGMMSPQERAALKKEMENFDDHEYMASGTESNNSRDIMRMISEAKNLAQQAAIAINMKKRGKKPKGKK
jgi:LysM repeat protein